MKRRTFLSLSSSSLAAWSCASIGKLSMPYVMTVNGKVSPSNMGSTLPHEHILVDFIGWKEAVKDRYNEDHALNAVLPNLIEIKKLGVQTFVDCTPNYLGRDLVLLKRLSQASGLHIITNTGIYAARNYQHVPDYAWDESPEQIAQRWSNEFQHGIGDTRVRPGFIKSGVNGNELAEMDEKLVRACCITSKATGLPFAIHTGKGTIRDQIRIIEEESAPLDSFIWTHCQNEGDIDVFTEAANKGVWLSLDGVGIRSADRYMNWLLQLKKQNLQHKVLLSQDSGWYDPGKPGGGVVRSYAYIFSIFIPMLLENGFTEDEIHTITATNPQKAFSIKSH